MKKELSGVELHYVIDEMQYLVGGKIDQIYQPSRTEVLFSIHVTGKGKSLLRVELPSFFYLTSAKRENPTTPYGFQTFLRKHIGNARIRSLKQIGFERIVEIDLEKKENYKLIIELYGKGNVILCDSDYKIIAPLDSQRWRERTIRGGIEYSFPEQKFDAFRPDYKVFKEILKESKGEIVKVLAKGVSLGGVFAEEVCLEAEIDKKVEKVNVKQIERLYKALKKVLGRKIKPVVYGKEVLPFALKTYEKEFVAKESFNAAIDEVLGFVIKEEKEKKLTSKFDKEINKYKKIIDVQKKTISKLEKDSKENQEKGERIYEKYQVVDEIINVINKVKKEKGWDEVKAKLKGHKVVKEVLPKEQRVVVDI